MDDPKFPRHDQTIETASIRTPRVSKRELSPEQKERKERLKKQARFLRCKKGSAMSKLTPKQKGFVESRYVDGKKVYESVAENYDVSTIEGATSQGSALNRNPKIKAAVDELYDSAGVTGDKLAQVVSQALEANTVIKNVKEGTAWESDVPDHGMRLKAVNIAHKARGDYVQRIESKSVHLHSTVEEVKQLNADYAEFLQQKYKNKQTHGDIPESVLD